MNDTVNWRFLFNDARARIYLVWAVLTFVGFMAAQYSQKDIAINSFWVILSAIGLGYMYKLMPMRMKPARRILNAWLIPIAIGSVVSYAIFYVPAGTSIIPYLGSFWLVVMAAGFYWNGTADAPAKWYNIASLQCLAAAMICAISPTFQAVQWPITAIVSAWSMLNLWAFRSETL